VPADNQVPQSSFSSSRILSALELLLGACIVIGYNVFHVVPIEVPILFVLGLLSIRLRDGRWSAMGLKRPASWLGGVLIALAAAALRIILSDLVIEPLGAHFWPPIVAPDRWEAIPGNIKAALFWLLLVWTFAAFGEEIGFRGYLLTRAADIGGRTRPPTGSELLPSQPCSAMGITTKVQPAFWISE
jgi:membrane protease YdiL (CAAX protease family)